MSIKGMQVSLKGVQLLQGGAVVSTAPTKLTIHSVRLVCSVGLFGWSVRLVHLRQVHPLSMHLQVHPLKATTANTAHSLQHIMSSYLPAIR